MPSLRPLLRHRWAHGVARGDEVLGGHLDGPLDKVGDGNDREHGRELRLPTPLEAYGGG